VSDVAELRVDPAKREKLAAILLAAVLLLALPLVLASVSRTFDDGDVSWHVAAGRWMIMHGAIPTTDPFSFTAAGQPWVAMEWLADLIFGSAYQLAGYAGLAAVVAAALMALHFILFLHLRRSVGPLGIATTFVAMDIVLSPFILARPHVLIWPILAGWTVILLRACEEGRAPRLSWALIMVAWTNMHASFPIGFVIGAGIGFDALVKAKWATLRQWSSFGLASLVAALVNANGLDGLLRPFHIAGLEMLPSIVEWQSSTPAITPQFYVVLFLTLGTLLWTGAKVPAGRLALLIVILALAFSQLRHQTWLAITAAIILPPLFGRTGWTSLSVRPYLLAGLPLLALRAAVPLTPPDDFANPRGLIAAIPVDVGNQPVFNDYTFGGPLILAGIKPYIDGRAEIYGDAFFANYKAMVAGDWTRFDQAVRHYGIQWTMLSSNDKLLLQELDASPSWKRIYSDRTGVIHVRITRGAAQKVSSSAIGAGR